MSVRVVPDKAMGQPFTVAFVIPDTKERYFVRVENGVMTSEKGVDEAADATLTVPRLALLGMISGQVKALDLMDQGVLTIDGNPLVLQRFLTIFEPPRPGFPLVTP
jgi:alkyl sulfatase BDS1-like metallo-beta-lactamase superfamily hydrolase